MIKSQSAFFSCEIFVLRREEKIFSFEKKIFAIKTCCAHSHICEIDFVYNFNVNFFSHFAENSLKISTEWIGNVWQNVQNEKLFCKLIIVNWWWCCSFMTNIWIQMLEVKRISTPFARIKTICYHRPCQSRPFSPFPSIIALSRF